MYFNRKKMIKKLLEKQGYKEVDNKFVKENWTIRLHDDQLEAFNNPDLEAGYYYTAPINNVDIETLLIDIDYKIKEFAEL